MTEPSYFKALRHELGLQTVEVVVEGEKCGSAPISVVNHALALKKTAPQSITRGPYDRIWCVIDVEVPTPHDSLAPAIDKAKANGLDIALSNPSFEYWYLLHFEKTSALMQSNQEVMQRLKKHHPQYKKNDRTFFSIVYPNTAKAIKNSEEVLKEKHYGEDLRKCNPSTHVHLVVEHLQGIAQRPCGR